MGSPVPATSSTPRMLRLVTENPSRLLNRQERVIHAEIAGERYVGENLGDEFCVGPRHDGVGGGDNESIETRRIEFEGFEHRLCTIPTVDITPEIPFPKFCIRVVGRKRRVVRWVHHV